MYRRFRPRRQRFFGPKRQKTFDPTQIINTPNRVENVVEYVVKNKFEDFDLTDKLTKNVLSKGYNIPTPIQDQSISVILEGRDIIGIANTGTGKTAAFLIPLINKVIKNPHEKVIILAPTRELAFQIRAEFFDFTKGLNVYSALCIGGVSMYHQVKDLRRNPNFVIGTPGRIEDHIRNRNLNLSDFRSVVLDEADHMVDIGFIKNIKNIISLLPQNRQSLFFSATIDHKVSEILKMFVKDPVTVSVKTQDTATGVDQKVVRLNRGENKMEHMHKMLITEGFDKVLIFGKTKHGVQKISDELRKRGFKSDSIHGNKRQNQRIKTLENFKRNNINILVATDVAARGIDVPNVSHVINYDMPGSREDYIHRIGRTGRADKKGVAITYTL